MAKRIRGNNLIVWGTGDASGLGVIQSASENLDGEKTELFDEDGETLIVIYFDDKNTCEFEALMQSDVTLPERGDDISIGGVVDAWVDNVELRWANRDAQRVMIRATKYPVALAAEA